MDITNPIDIEMAITGLGGDPKIFYMMLGNFEDMTLTEHMKNLVVPYDTKDHKVFKDLAHGLKGASGYIGASRLHYVCYFIQEHFVYERYEK